MGVSTRRFSTGLPFLDRKIGGGLEPGGLLAFTAPLASQSELVLAELIRSRHAVVVSTTRPEAEVERWAASKDATGGLDVLAADAETLLEDPDLATAELTPESFLVVDSVDGLETADRERYLSFLDHLKERLRETESVGVLHCTDQVENPPRRGLSLHRADNVWQLEVLVLSREIKTRLLVRKARHGRALTEPVPLRLTDRVQVDTSRRIA